MKRIKKEEGITLVALIITIIVLLILAVVTISAVNEGSLFSHANNAATTYSEKATEENALISDYITKIEQHNVDGNDTKKSVSTGIDYGSKTAETIEPGDDISIGDQNFKVFSVSSGVIKAMPYHNITLTSSPVQDQEADFTMFSSERYWENTNVDADVDMTDSRNNIQQYIAAYKATLESKGASAIDVRIGTESELFADGITDDMRNPSEDHDFWVGSLDRYDTDRVDVMSYMGNYVTGYPYHSTSGVRPILIIYY